MKRLFVVGYNAAAGRKKDVDFFSLGEKTAELFCEFEFKFTEHGTEYFNSNKNLKILIDYDRVERNFGGLCEIRGEGDDKEIDPYKKSLETIFLSCGFLILS